MKTKGFSLLEAIVALVLVAMVGMALFAWINTNLNNLYRIQQIQKRHEAVRNAIEFMETVNPMLRPKGDMTVGLYRFKWQAEPLTEPMDNASGIKGQGLYQVVLYKTSVDIFIQTDYIFNVKLQQVGYKQVREPAWKAWE